ncbi:MAG: hypothetical protein ABSF71_00080 [Terriglobia bacterium]
MGSQSVSTGAIGEALAADLLLPYFTISKLVPDSGVDFVAELKESYGDPFSFAIQVKLATVFKVKTKVFVNWIERLDIQPVMLLLVERFSSRAQRFWFRILYDWMLENPDWERLRRQTWATFALSEFTLVDVSDSNFRAAVQREISRVRRSPSSLWRSERRPAVPMSVSDLSRTFGVLSIIEPPASVLKEISEVKSFISERDQWAYLRSLWAGDDEGRRLGIRDLPSTTGWCQRILRTRPEACRNREVEEFRRFIRAMQLFDRGKPFRLPRYNWDTACV